MTAMSTEIEIIHNSQNLQKDDLNFEELKSMIVGAGKGMLSFASDMIVDNEESYKKITALYSDARKWKKYIEERRTQVVAPLRAQINKVNDTAKELDAAFDSVVHIANIKANGYQKLLEERKKAEELSIKEAAALFDIGEDEIYIAPLDNNLKGSGATASTVVKKKFKIVDANLIPRKYLMIDEKAVERDIKLGLDQIDGLEIYQEKQTTLRVR
jgi:hypothetical protein